MSFKEFVIKNCENFIKWFYKIDLMDKDEVNKILFLKKIYHFLSFPLFYKDSVKNPSYLKNHFHVILFGVLFTVLLRTSIDFFINLGHNNFYYIFLFCLVNLFFIWKFYKGFGFFYFYLVGFYSVLILIGHDNYFKIFKFFPSLIYFILCVVFYFKKDIEKFIWGVQIQSPRSTAFAIIFMLFSSVILSISVNSYFNNNLSFSEKQTIYYQDQSQQIKIKKFSENQKIEQEILDKKVGDKIDDNLSGLGDIMIGIGSALMALSIFVYEQIVKRKSNFDKSFYSGLTNATILTISYFVGVFGLLLVYVFENYDWVKIFLEPALYCYVFLLIIFLGARFLKISLVLLYKKQKEKSFIEMTENYLDFVKTFKNHKENYSSNQRDLIIDYLEDFFSETKKNLKNEDTSDVVDNWNLIYYTYSRMIDLYNLGQIKFIHNKAFSVFLLQYFYSISTKIPSYDYAQLLFCNEKIFEIILEKYFIKKNDYEFSHTFQDYLFCYQAMYQKGFEMQKELDKLSSNEKSIANILLDRSRRTPKELANYDLLYNFRNNKINPEFFENYAKEFLIYFRDLALKCFENNDVDNFDKTLLSLKNTFREYLEYGQVLDNILQKTYKYKEAVLYGIGACILCEAKIDDKENNIEKIGKFLVIINKHFNQILNIQISNNWQYYEGKGEKIFKIFCNAKEDKIYNYLAGIDKYSFKVDFNKDYDDFDYNFDDNQKKNSNEIIYNFFIFILLTNPEYYNFRSEKIIPEISKIIGLQKDWFFENIIEILKNLKSKFENNFEIIIHNSKKQKTKVAFDYLILQLLRECKIEKIKENIDELNGKLNEIKSFLKSEKGNYISNEKADQDLIKKCKNDLIEGYYKINNIKKTKIFQINIPSKDVKPNKILIINPIYDKEPFIKDSKISTDIGRAIGEKMAKSENRLITNEIINKIKPESQKIDLNKFHDIILQIPNIKDAVIILLSNPYELTRELKKHTFYNDNFKSLNDEDKKLYPQKYNKEQIGFYEIFVENKPYEIPVYDYYSDKADGVMVLDKSRLGTIIQYDMSDDYKEREIEKKQIEKFLREQKFDENFTKEFYLDLIEFDDNNQYFKNLLDQEKQPDWIKQKGDRTEQIKFLKQHVIFVFKQAFEIEFAKNFFGYLFEIEKEY